MKAKEILLFINKNKQQISEAEMRDCGLFLLMPTYELDELIKDLRTALMYGGENINKKNLKIGGVHIVEAHLEDVIFVVEPNQRMGVPQ